MTKWTLKILVRMGMEVHEVDFENFGQGWV